MRVVSGETSLVLTDRPIVERLFNAFTSVVGGFTAWMCLRFYNPGGGWGDLALALFAPFLLVFAIAGLWRMLTLPTAICRLDRPRRIVELDLRTPIARRRMSWAFDDVAEIRAHARSGYTSSFHPMLVLRDGRRFILAPNAHADRETVERFVLQARQIMTSA